MYSIPQVAKDAMYDINSERTITAEVMFDITDTTAYSDVSGVTTNSESSVSRKAQITDRNRASTYQLASYEQDRFALNGAFSFPDDVLANNGEVGFESGALCDASCNFKNNLIDGDCESTAPFTGAFGSTVTFTTDPTAALYGGNAIKIDATGAIFRGIPITLTSGKNYIVLADIKSSDGIAKSWASVRRSDGTYLRSINGVASSTYLPDYYTFTANGLEHYVGIYFSRLTGSGYSNFDGIRIYEITSTEKALVDGGTLTRAQIADIYRFQAKDLPTLTVTFTSTHSSAGLTLTFDREQNEYATDFDVSVYNGASLITSVSVVGNTNVIAEPLGQLANYNKVVITFKKWSKPYRRVRLLELDFGIVKVYTDDNIVRCSLIEEMDMTSTVVPSAEFSFSVDNTDRAFNILNPTGFYKYLQQRQIITPSLSIVHAGGKTKIPLGQYYLTEWTSNEGSMTATLKGRDILDIMANTMHENLSPVSITLAACAQNIFTKCGITDYYLDPVLSTITTNALVARTDCRTILQMIAIAGTCKVFRNRTGQIRLVKEDAFTTSDDRIDFDNAYAEPEIQLANIVKTVEVTYWTNLTTSAVTTINAANVPNGETLQLTDNTLINSSTHATNVANWVLSQRNGFRAIYSIPFRGNPAHELCDIVDIENSYGADKQAFITKNELTYEGYLKARTEARGVSV